MPYADYDLKALTYIPQNFRDLAQTDLGTELWDFLREHDNLVRMETATILERAAVEPLAMGLVDRFGDQIHDDRTKQMIGHMTRQIMDGLGYELDRTALRITRPSLFTSGATYREPHRGDRSMNITAEQRKAWVEKTSVSPFNIWLDGIVKRKDGTLDLDKLFVVAQRYGITDQYDKLNNGQKRMNVGVRLRKELKKRGIKDEDLRPGTFPGVK